MKTTAKAESLIDLDRCVFGRLDGHDSIVSMNYKDMIIFNHLTGMNLSEIKNDKQTRQNYLELLEEIIEQTVFKSISAEAIKNLSSNYIKHLWIWNNSSQQKDMLHFSLTYLLQEGAKMVMSYQSNNTEVHCRCLPFENSGTTIEIFTLKNDLEKQSYIYNELGKTKKLPGFDQMFIDMSDFDILERGYNLSGDEKFYCILPSVQPHMKFRNVLVFDKTLWPITKLSADLSIYKELSSLMNLNEKEIALLEILYLLESI